VDISPEQLGQIVAHAHEEYENECCGLVAVPIGEHGDEHARAMSVRRARNIHESPKRFEIDGKDAVKAVLDFESEGWEIGAIYHSHTHTPPYPSQTDINFSREWPGVEWIIVGLADPEKPEIRSYLIEEGSVREVEIGQIAV
jgi:[CysO sulfur-carrier protein]-S-L-cysteine hydrolase